MKSQISKSKLQIGESRTAAFCLELECLEIGSSLEFLSAIALAKADGTWDLELPAPAVGKSEFFEFFEFFAIFGE